MGVKLLRIVESPLEAKKWRAMWDDGTHTGVLS